MHRRHRRTRPILLSEATGAPLALEVSALDKRDRVRLSDAI